MVSGKESERGRERIGVDREVRESISERLMFKLRAEGSRCVKNDLDV